MRIYLDQCVIQYLKSDEGKTLLRRVLDDSSRNIYVFSEAHLYDLRHDRTDEKFADMDLLEQIAADHCMHYEDERVKFNKFTPRVYYNRFDWDAYFIADTFDNPLFTALTGLWKFVPMDFKTLMPADNLPADMPDEMRELFFKGSTMYDFFVSFTGMSRALTNEQKRFKVLLQYLHKHDFLSPVYQSMGIAGFNGEQITDREQFFETFSAWCEKLTTQKNSYNHFLMMYNSLEMLGFVKGKPKKQKLMNMVNDGRHAFFGTYCDVIVSRDEDFVRKSSFIYAAIGISPLVLSVGEFSEWLEQHAAVKGGADILNFLKTRSDDDLYEERESNGTLYSSYWLPSHFFCHFNLLTIANDETGAFFYLSAIDDRCSNGQVMMAEIERLTSLISVEFGKNLQDKGGITEEEQAAGNWPGRSWFHEGFIIELLINNGLHLTFNVYNPEV